MCQRTCMKNNQVNDNLHFAFAFMQRVTFDRPLDIQVISSNPEILEIH